MLLSQQKAVRGACDGIPPPAHFVQGLLQPQEIKMHIQINTDHNIDGHEGLATQVKSVVADALSRFSDRITRVEVHLSDQNSDKSGQVDKRCVMEARIEGRQPTAVTNDAANVADAVHGAADKMKRSLASTLDRLADVRRKQ